MRFFLIIYIFLFSSSLYCQKKDFKNYDKAFKYFKKNNFDKLKNCFFYSDINKACKNADLIILHTEWDEFKSLDFKKLVKKKNFKIFDLRNLYNFNEMLNKKIKYYSVGRPDIN